MIKKVQLPSGAIEYVDTNPNLIKTTGKKAKGLIKRMTSKIINILKLNK